MLNDHFDLNKRAGGHQANESPSDAYDAQDNGSE